jgi:hypothetical protein
MFMRWRLPKRFWGHPDNWNDAAWDEYMDRGMSGHWYDRLVCWWRGWEKSV